jgi:osmoprotectant transport system substrate-binding protein
MLNMSRSLRVTIFLLVAVAVAFPSFSAHACVGRKLVLGSVEADRPGMVSRILSILIHERTGTTVEVKFFPDRNKLLAAVEKHKVNLYVDYVDSAIDRLKVEVSSTDENERFKAVKRLFDEELNQVWLKPMGYSGISKNGRSMGPASIVVHKDTLKKFPALPRLLEKIGTRVVLDDGHLDSLVSKARSEKPAKVARNYLKEVKLI